MDFFTILTLFAHVIAVVILISTLPRQLSDIWKEKETRYRKICWIIFLGTTCLTLTNALQLLVPLFYGSESERLFNNITSLFNALIAIILGLLAHILYKITNKTIPHTVEDIEKRIEKD